VGWQTGRSEVLFVDDEERIGGAQDAGGSAGGCGNVEGIVFGW
jgi:hypothetical protein